MKKFHLATTSAGMEFKQNNTTVEYPVTIGWESIKELESFIYLEGVVDREDGTEHDVKSRNGKATAAFTIEHLGIKGHPNYY